MKRKHQEREREPAATRIECTHCGQQIPVTPVLKTHIVSYFAGVLEIRENAPTIGQRNNLRIRVEGEAITSDEFMAILDEQRAAKEAAKEEKKKQAKEKKKNSKKQSKSQDKEG